MTEPDGAAPDPATNRGRPRPDATIERDKRVYEHLATVGAQSRAAIAVATGMTGKEVYLSLYRLSRATPAKAARTGATWSALDEDGAAIVPAPVPTEPAEPAVA